jgi:hypothetical protein
VAVRHAGAWRILTGNEIGTLLAWWAWLCFRKSHPTAIAGTTDQFRNTPSFSSTIFFLDHILFQALCHATPVKPAALSVVSLQRTCICLRAACRPGWLHPLPLRRGSRCLPPSRLLTSVRRHSDRFQVDGQPSSHANGCRCGACLVCDGPSSVFHSSVLPAFCWPAVSLISSFSSTLFLLWANFRQDSALLF